GGPSALVAMSTFGSSECASDGWSGVDLPTYTRSEGCEATPTTPATPIRMVATLRLATMGRRRRWFVPCRLLLIRCDMSAPMVRGRSPHFLRRVGHDMRRFRGNVA